MPLKLFYEMDAESLPNDSGQDILEQPAAFLQADLLEEIIFCAELWHKVKGHLSETVKCIQALRISQ
jgi:hypothetical protein